MKITLAQLNSTIGDFEGNLSKACRAIEQAKQEQSDLIVFSELYLTGYPPRDLLEKSYFVDQAETYLSKLSEFSKNFPDLGILIGTIERTQHETGKGLYNAAVLIQDGEVLFRQPKSLLPNYDVFDEMRYFDVAPNIDLVHFKGERLGITICEDAWNDPEFWPRREYDFDPVHILAQKGATMIINLSASPFHAGKETIRYHLISNHVKRHNIPFVFVNQIGGNDELIFDGKSMVAFPEQETMIQFKGFSEQVETIDLAMQIALPFKPQHEIASVHDALILGIQDYLKKCGFKQVVLGLSGGIDSALVCTLASEALGPENVLALAMPSPYSSQGSVDDAKALAKNLGVDFKIIPIHDLFQPYLDNLVPLFEGRPEDTTEENMQARIRGNIVMSFSNKFGRLALSTGNKSELAVGYCTLYGDMSGGLSVISDVPKMMVYALCEYINREKEIIPKSIIEKPPSAELKPDQKDQDSLPPYEILDSILSLYVDEKQSRQQIVDQGYDAKTVDWIIRTVNINEYKRRQAAPGLKVTTKAFGIGRRMPVAAKH